MDNNQEHGKEGNNRADDKESDNDNNEGKDTSANDQNYED